MALRALEGRFRTRRNTLMAEAQALIFGRAESETNARTYMVEYSTRCWAKFQLR